MTPSPGADPGDIPHLRMPSGPEVFRLRAARLRALAPGHSAGDYLSFLAELASAQAQVAERIDLPAGPLDLRGGPVPAAWREALPALLSAIEAAPAPTAARAAMAHLRTLPAADLDALAGRVRAGDLGEQEAAFAPFVGAALQVVYTSVAARFPAASVERSQDGSCPVCGSPPVAGVVLADGGLRYLACSLCGSEWHRTRVQCATCGGSADLSYLGIEPGNAAVKAEACGGCRTFLKLFYLERDPGADPFADDVATLALDLRLAGEGYARGGVSCFWA